MSKKEFEELINSIMYKTGMTQEQLSVDAGYNKGYISQLISRGTFSPKFITLLKNKYLSNSKETQEYVAVNVGDELRIIRETNTVILSAVAELLARATNQTVTVVQNQLEGLVNERLNTPSRERSAL